jgi:acetyl esterase
MTEQQQEQTFELDDRMSDETKVFVQNALRALKPSLMPKIDVNLIRKSRLENALKMNSLLNFEVETRDFNITNTIDNNHEVPVTLYLPKSHQNLTSLTVFFHGGGWTFGSRLIYHNTVASLTECTRTAWLSVEYRLAPEHKINAQLSDCRTVMDWTLQNADSLLNTKQKVKIGVSGDSAGGHLAAVMAHEFKSSIDYQILIYPCVDLANVYDSNKEFDRECFILVPEALEFFYKNLLGEDDAESLAKKPEASPLFNEDFSGLPKCLIIAAALDPLVDQSRAYNDKLRSNSIECDLKIVNGAIHGFFHNGILVKNAFREALTNIENFFSRKIF